MPQLDFYNYFAQVINFFFYMLFFLFIFSTYLLPKIFSVLFIRIKKNYFNFHSTIINSPLEQFDVIIFLSFKLFDYFDFYIINSFCLFFINIIWLIMLLFSFVKRIYVIPVYNIYQFLNEYFYVFILKLLTSNSGFEGQQFFPLLFNLAIALLLGNMLGMIPYGFTLTSHIVISLFCSFSMFLSINVIGLKVHKLKIMSLFLPNGTPFLISPFLFLIELLSYFSRLFSLAIRLFANMMSGHTLLKILTTFLLLLFHISNFFIFFNFLPVLILHIIMLMEFCIALLQVYVFSTLLSIYIRDIFFLH